MWYALLIPVIISLLALIFFRHHIIWWEVLIPTVVGFLFIICSYEVQKNSNLKDVEYNGYLITQAQYFEYWESWVKKTCSYTTCNGRDKNGNCTGYTTHYYDCSYCDTNQEYFRAIDNHGNSFSITKRKYLDLKAQWSASDVFHELNRKIINHGGCGQDGDMYSIHWNNKVETSESSVLEVPFENIVKISHSAFNYPDISQEEAKKLSLYDYPKEYDFYKQKCLLGIDSIGTIEDRGLMHKRLEYINGYLGPINKVKVFTLIFKNKPIDIAWQQEIYWDGGNQNEIVVCIGTDEIGNIEWVKPFSWCDNKRILVDLREDIMETKVISSQRLFDIYMEDIPKNFKYKSFKDFNYLTFEPTDGQLLFVYIGTLIISLLIVFWTIVNPIKPED